MRIPLSALVALAAACSLIACFAAADAATYSVGITDNKGSYAQGTSFQGIVTVGFDTLLPQNARLVATVDDSNPSYLYLLPYINGTSYQYRSYQFWYNLTANGRNQWYEYPNKQFWYRIKASGTCGNDECASSGTCDCAGLCTPPFCSWNVVYIDAQGSVSASDGLKFMLDASTIIAPPVSSNGDTSWSEILNNPNSPYDVQTTMRMACGSMDYAGRLTDQDGWIKMTLQGFQPIPGSYWQKASVGQFDPASLTTDRQKFISSGCSQPYTCGGIYRDTALLVSGTDYTANATSGEVIIKTYSPSSVYTMVYLPPNGPYLCAYTSSKSLNSTTWAKVRTETGSVSYSAPFYRNYTQVQLPSSFNDTNSAFINPPPCPYYAQECTQTATSYSASMANDPTRGSIRISYNAQARSVAATLLSPEIASRLIVMNLSGFTGLSAPSYRGQHTLAVSLESGGSELARSETMFTVCEDKDGDGYCSIASGGDDCNDNPAADPAACKPDPIDCSQAQYSVCAKCINPGAAERCDGVDNNCDGLIDEPFQAAGSKLGTQCGVGACAGTWVCSANRTAVMCNSTIKPGQLPEICGNGIDDDCDGVVDELYEMNAQGVPVRGCVCKDGDTKECGSNIGACRPGHQVCVNGEWSKCLGAVGPTQEVCNGIDDDCNGVIDDVNGGNSIASTKCGCYGGALPSPEVCDTIDNDCNGAVDDGVKCCTPGQTRACGVSYGSCKAGTQMCGPGGEWGAACTGEVKPADGNCNTPIITPDSTCSNGRMDPGEEGVDCGGICPDRCQIATLPLNWVLIAVGVLMIVLVVGYLEMKGRF